MHIFSPASGKLAQKACKSLSYNIQAVARSLALEMDRQVSSAWIVYSSPEQVGTGSVVDGLFNIIV